MKKIYIIIFSFLPLLLSAQVSIQGDLSKIRTDTIKKRIVDNAKYVIYYDYAVQANSASKEQVKKGHTVLQIGELYNRFTDLHELRYDSIFDRVSKEKLSMNEHMQSALNEGRARLFRKNILINKETGIATIQDFFVSKITPQYEEKGITLNWELLEGDTIITDIPCRKASLTFRGRNYIAWYAPNIDLPYGPYLFNGLPGLILHIADTKNDYSFTIAGLEKRQKVTPIYFKMKKVSLMSRKDVRQLYKTYCLDAASIWHLISSFPLTPDGKDKIQPKPYNPIELE